MNSHRHDTVNLTPCLWNAILGQCTIIIHLQAHATTQGCFSVVILRYSRTVWQNHCSHFLTLTEKLFISLLWQSPGGWVRRKIYRGNQVFMVFPFHFHKTPPTDVIYCFCCKCCLLGATGISNAVLTREMVKTQWGSKQSPPQNPQGRWGICTLIHLLKLKTETYLLLWPLVHSI